MGSIVLRNAHVYLPAGDFARGAVVLDGNRIADVVPHAYQPQGQLQIDLGGAFVIPGLIDTHFHLTSLALKALRCDLSAAMSAEDAAGRLASYAAGSDAPFVVGVEWDESGWQDPAFPTRVMLDRVDNVRPVLARRICGHVGVVNRVLLERLTPRPALIDRDSGLVREHALWEAGTLCEPGASALAHGMGAAVERLHGLGVTAIHDIVEPAKLEPYLAGLAAAGAPLSIDMLLHCHPREFAEWRARAARYDVPGVRLAGVKCFLDGSLGGRTAALHEPYEDGEGNGTLLMDDETLDGIVRGSAEAGIVCAMHAIGDRAIDQALDALERVRPQAGHFRMEHAEITGPCQIERLARSPLCLAMQPNFVRNWGGAGGLYEARLGRDRVREINRFRTLLNAGVPVIFGSDGMPPGPLFGLPGAVWHPNPAERLSPRETLLGYTDHASRAPGHVRDAGSIEPGRLADLVVLAADPLAAGDPAAGGEPEVLQTWVGGRRVFARGGDGTGELA